MLMLAVFVMTAIPSFASGGASNADLDDVTGDLIEQIGFIKDNGLLIIGVCIIIFATIFGIGWLIRIVRKKMSAAG
jgi:hypothetical protein